MKIRRDARGMPFAFVQYEVSRRVLGSIYHADSFKDENDAQRAISDGRGMLINGRPCRTEVAKVNRKLILLAIRRSFLL